MHAMCFGEDQRITPPCGFPRIELRSQVCKYTLAIELAHWTQNGNFKELSVLSAGERLRNAL